MKGSIDPGLALEVYLALQLLVSSFLVLQGSNIQIISLIRQTALKASLLLLQAFFVQHQTSLSFLAYSTGGIEKLYTLVSSKNHIKRLLVVTEITFVYRTSEFSVDFRTTLWLDSKMQTYNKISSYPDWESCQNIAWWISKMEMSGSLQQMAPGECLPTVWAPRVTVSIQ